MESVFFKLLFYHCLLSTQLSFAYTDGNITTNAKESNVTIMNDNNTIMTSYCNSRPDNFYKTTSVFLVPFIPVTILGNILVCIVVFVSPVFYKQPSYLLITSLAVADILVGAVSMPIKAVVQWHHNNFCLPNFVCWIYILEEITFSLTSVAHLFAIALERYIGLKYTYRYKNLVTCRRTAIAIVILWTFSILCSLLSIIKWTSPLTVSIRSEHGLCLLDNREFMSLVYIVFFIIPLVLMTYFYHFVYKTSARHINEITKLEILNSPDSREKKRRNRYFRMIRSITIVFAVYTICWMPTVVFIFVVFYFSECIDVTTPWFPSVYFILIQFLPHLNSTANPFIYVLSNAEFRYVACKWLFRKPSERYTYSMNTIRTSQMVVSNALEMVNSKRSVEMSFIMGK